MARKRAPQKKTPTRLTKTQIKKLMDEQRRMIDEKIGVIPQNILFEFGSADIANIDESRIAGHFSDWPDSFSKGTWYKTWGKAGGDIRADTPVEQIRPTDVLNALDTVRRGTKKT